MSSVRSLFRRSSLHRSSGALTPASALGALLFAGALAGCGGGGDSPAGAVPGAGGAMSVLSCSLGCGGGGTVACSVSQVHVNQDIWVEFTQPVVMASVNKNSFQVIDAVTGQTPPGTYVQDPVNPRRVAFRPQLGFDSSGNATFGLQAGHSYRVTIPGASSSGAKVLGVGGQPNQSNLQCFVQAALGVNDVVPGAPNVSVVIDGVPGVGTIPAQSAEDVPFDVHLRFLFDDLMNPATLVHPATGVSESVRVTVDLDGDLASKADRIPLNGTFQIALDLDAFTTTVFFSPTGGFPSSGSDPAQPRRIVIELPPSITDIADTPLANAGEVVFTTESMVFPPAVLPKGDGEDFADTSAVDLRRSGALFEPPSGGEELGRARPGYGGGSGQMGDLVVAPGSTVVLGLGADGSSFGPGVTTNPATGDVHTYVVDNYDTTLGELPGETDVTAVDSIYEFASLVVEAGGILRFAGDVPPRIHVRGDLRIAGRVSLTGSSPGLHDAQSVFGQEGAPGAPGGGAGGKGADRSNQTDSDLSKTFPGGVSPIGGAAPGSGVVTLIDGTVGEGRGGAANAGGGLGGVHWPANFPGPLVTDVGGMIATSNVSCQVYQLGAPGGGGSFGSLGGPSFWTYGGIPASWIPPGPPPTPAGPDLLFASQTTLDPELGLLIGGAGGGGGGTGVAGSLLAGVVLPPTPCSGFPAPINGPSGQIPPSTPFLQIFNDSSAAGGGGGGGALHLQVGREAAVTGVVDLTGGPGGGSFVQAVVQKMIGAPGGGGSGGALLLQAQIPALASLAGVIDVRGGAGGYTEFTGARGGAGGGGVVRIEVPTDAPVSTATEAAKVLPASGGVGQPALGEVVHVTEWVPKNTGPSARSGFQSCWLIPAGAVFEVEYAVDDFSDPQSPVLGWNLVLEFEDGMVSPYRGPGAFATAFGQDPETAWGGDLGTAPVVVRFQGARVVGGLADPCVDTSLVPGSEFLPGSLTPWVRHPAELNDYWTTALPGDPQLAAQRKPNAIRYQVIFDRSAVAGDTIAAARSVEIHCQPD